MDQYKNIAVIVLAAGKGTRMKSELPKVLHTIKEKAMILYVLETALKINNKHIHVVVGHQAEKVKQIVLEHCNVSFALQEKLLGTGDAVKAAINDISCEVEDVIVLCGDVPLIKSESLSHLIDYQRNNHISAAVLAVQLDNPYGYGRIIQDSSGHILSIKEESDANKIEKKIKIVNSGIYCFKKHFLIDALNLLKSDNEQKEYYLTDLIEIAKNQGKKTGFIMLKDQREVIGVNTPIELAKAEELIDIMAHELP